MSVFFTGFPGFLGSELLPRILARMDDAALCLVQPKFRVLAEERVRLMEKASPSLAGRIRLVEGDLTQPLSAIDCSEIREIYHFAAIYDLSVRREVAMHVNVAGTENVLDLAGRASRLERLHYVSTCYVSGRFEGIFTEDDLEKGQTFNNFYEETKYLAEAAVRKRMSEIPATIYRPAVVAGHSATGATQKFDGLYFILQWILRQPRIAVLPVVGRTARHTFNVVPSDFVIRALDYLSTLPHAVGRTYALADPDPLTVDETIREIARATSRTILRIPMTKGLAKLALESVPGVYRFMRIPAAAVDYFVHPARYDTSHATRELAAAGIQAPRFRDYASKLVEFVRAHPEIAAEAMA